MHNDGFWRFGFLSASDAYGSLRPSLLVHGGYRRVVHVFTEEPVSVAHVHHRCRAHVPGWSGRRRSMLRTHAHARADPTIEPYIMRRRFFWWTSEMSISSPSSTRHPLAAAASESMSGTLNGNTFGTTASPIIRGSQGSATVPSLPRTGRGTGLYTSICTHRHLRQHADVHDTACLYLHQRR